MTKCKCRRLCIHEEQAVLFFVVVFYDSIVSEHGKSKQEQHPDIVQSVCEKAVFFYLKAQAVFEIKPKINSSKSLTIYTFALRKQYPNEEFPVSFGGSGATLAKTEHFLPN